MLTLCDLLHGLPLDAGVVHLTKVTLDGFPDGGITAGTIRPALHHSAMRYLRINHVWHTIDKQREASLIAGQFVFSGSKVCSCQGYKVLATLSPSLCTYCLTNQIEYATSLSGLSWAQSGLWAGCSIPLALPGVKSKQQPSSSGSAAEWPK